jgi:hypothetical protein
LNRLRPAASLRRLGSQRGARQGGGSGFCVRAAAGRSRGGAQETSPFIGVRTPRSPWCARQERWRRHHGGFGLWLKAGLRWARMGRRLGGGFGSDGLRFGPSWAVACKVVADRRKRRGGVGGLRRLGSQPSVGRKRKGERKFIFIFRKHFRGKQDNLE